MPPLAETLASYLPALLLQQLANDASTPINPTRQSFPAAVLFADISGYTALTERYAAHGPAGVEELSRLLNTFRGQLLDVIAAHGGDVVKFAGDSLYAVWPVGVVPSTNENGNPPGQGKPELAETLQRAAQCALAIQETLQSKHATEQPSLSLKISLASGEILIARLGGVYGRWLVLVAGEALAEVNRIQQDALPGQVLVAPAAWQAIASQARGLLLASSIWQLKSLLRSLPLQSTERPTLPPSAEPAIRAFVPAAILARLAAGQRDWLAELRQITVLFVNLPDLDQHTDLAQSHTLVQTLQTTLYRYEGSINELSSDDKGVMLVAAFGLPPLSHDDDPARGILGALAVQERLRELGVRYALGVATARLFCGVVGSEQRREYALIGDGMNLAARLMQAAPGTILCDHPTYEASKARLEFEALPALQLKGKTAPIPVYRPLRERPHAQVTRASLIGRTRERTLLAARLQTLLRAGAEGPVIIEGEAGIGKSRLVADLLDQARQLGVTPLLGAGDAIERSSAYHAWRPVFSQLFELEGTPAPPTEKRAAVLARLHHDPEMLRLAPLLNAVLPLDFPENESTAQMSGQVRAENTRTLLLDLILTTAREHPTLLVLEDAHWLDSASWALALALAARQQPMPSLPLLLVLVTRPLSDPLPAGLPQLLQAPGTARLYLEMLPPAETLALVCQRLGVGQLPEEVATLIREKAEGHPFFSEELAYALRDLGLIEIKDGTCRLVSQQPLSQLKLPTTIEGTITSRIDRLPPPEQLTLKVATVIGRTFPFHTLQAIHPITTDRPQLPAHLTTLARLDLTPLDTPEPDLAYIFKHIITQEVAYNLMLFDQRRQLHRAVAEWYEQTYASDLTPYAPLLAHHWQQAQVRTKALDALELAGNAAIRNGAFEEATRFFDTALALGSAEPAERRAHWHLQLGEAHHFANPPLAQQHLQQALALFGWPVPHSQAGLLRALLGQFAQQLSHRLWGAQRHPREATQRSKAARAALLLAIVTFTTQETTLALYISLVALNLAETVGPSAELAQAYATVGIMSGLLPSVARAYRRLAVATAEAVGPHAETLGAWFTVTAFVMATANWAEGEPAIKQMAALARQSGDWRYWELAHVFQSMLEHFQGRLQQSIATAEVAFHSVRQRGDRQIESGVVLIQTMSLLPLGDFEQARTRTEAIYPFLDDHPRRQAWAYGIYAQVALALGDLALARQHAERGLEILLAAPIFSPYGISDLLVIESCLTLIEQPGFLSNQEQSDLLRRLRRLHLTLWVLGQFIKPYRAAVRRCQGRLAWHNGQPARAQQLWRESLAVAERLATPYEQALTHYELGRHASGPERYYHLARACALFEQLGTAPDLARAQAAAQKDSYVNSNQIPD
jgi:predicted ATPase/class 3 adenylate cyclase